MSIKLLTLSALAATVVFAAPASVQTRQGLSPNAATVDDNIQGWQDGIADVNAVLNVASILSPAQLAEEVHLFNSLCRVELSERFNRLLSFSSPLLAMPATSQPGSWASPR